MIELQSPEEKEMNDFVDTLQHWHFQPANPNKLIGEYQSCQVQSYSPAYSLNYSRTDYSLT